MIDIIKDTLIDALKLMPFLFVAFLIIEIIEHKLSKKSKDIITSSGKYGPIIGSLLGAFPQCGFSVIATNLYITRIISLGTLISIYLSTSDEMLPILISQKADASLIISTLLIKIIIGMFAGFIIDLILKKKNVKKDYHICEEEHCHCSEGIWLSTIIHTLKTILFIIIISFILNLIMEYKGSEFLSNLFLKDSLLSPFISSFIGLIPNCGASVMITELYLNNAISFGAMISGLLTGSGVALLVLFKSNKNIKENFLILSLIYSIGVFFGVLIEIANLFI